MERGGEGGKRKQDRILGHQLRTGGQGRKCANSHFSTRADGPMDGPTDGQSLLLNCVSASKKLRLRLTLTNDEKITIAIISARLEFAQGCPKIVDGQTCECDLTLMRDSDRINTRQ